MFYLNLLEFEELRGTEGSERERPFKNVSCDFLI